MKEPFDSLIKWLSLCKLNLDVY